MLSAIGRFLQSRLALMIPCYFFLVGILMVVVSFFIRVAIVEFQGHQVGFLTAPNWTLVYIIIAPLLAVLTLLILHNVRQLPSRLASRRMIYDCDSGTISKSPEPLVETWTKYLHGALMLWLVLTLVILAVSLVEWHRYSADPLWTYDADLSSVSWSEVEFEPDWAVAAGLPDSQEDVRPTPNIVFALLAWVLLQTPVFSVGFLFLCLIMAFGAFIAEGAFGLYGRVRIIPDVGDPTDGSESEDVRRGFQVFEFTGSMILVAGLAVYVALYLSIVQNQYLEQVKQEDSNLTAASAYGLMVRPAAAGAAAGPEEAGGGLLPFLGIELALNFSTGVDVILGIVVIAFIFFLVPAGVLSSAAWASRQFATDQIRAGRISAEELGVDLATALARLRGMKLWPYAYFNLNLLLIGLILSFAALFWYQLAPYLFGIALILAVGHLALRARRVLSI